MWMDLVIIMFSEINQGKNSVWYNMIYGKWSYEILKIIQWEYMQNRDILTDTEHKLKVTRL